MQQASPAHVHASDSEPGSCDADGLQERACELSAARAQTHRHTDTQTHRHTDTQTQTDRHRDKQTNRQTDKQTQTQTDTDRQTQTDSQTDRQRNRYQRQRDQQTKRDRERHRQRQRQKETHLRSAARRILMSTCHRLHLRTRPTPSPGDGLQERACELSAARAPVARGRWPLVPWHPRPVERASGKRFALVSALPRCSRGQEVVAGLGTLPARFGLVVWIGVLDVRGWFPIQLQHDPGVQTPKPPIQTSN